MFPSHKKCAAGARACTFFAVSLAAASTLVSTLQPLRAGTEDDVSTTSPTALDTASNYSNPSGSLPTATSDVTFTNSMYTNTAFTDNTTALTMNSLNDENTSQALSITGSKTITLSGGSADFISGVTGDLIYVATGASLSLGEGIVLANSGNFDTAGSLTITSAISGAYSLTASGTGTLTLSASDSFGGTGKTFTLSSGATVVANANQALGATTGGIVINGGTLGSTSATTLSTYTGGIAVNGSFTLNANGNNFSTGGSAVTLGASAITISTSGANLATIGGAVSGTSNVTLSVGASGGLTLSAAQNEAGTITNSGAGTGTTTITGVIGANVTGITENSSTSPLALSGADTNYDGTTNLTSGTLTLSSATALGGNGSTTGAGGALNIAGGTTLGITVSMTTVNAENWNGSFTVAPTGSDSLGTGAITLGASNIQVTNNTANTLTAAGAVSGTSNLTLNATAAGGFTFSGGVNNTGTITNSGAGTGTVTISGTAGVGANVSSITENGTSPLTLSGTNTNYDGTTNLTAGSLTLSSATALGGNGTTTGTGGTLNIAAGTTLAGNATLTTVNAVNLNGDFTYGGTTNLLSLGTSSTTSLGTAAAATRTITFASTGALVLGGLVTNSNGGATATTLIKSGSAGILDLSDSSNSFSNLTVNGGEVLNSTATSLTNANFTGGGTYATAANLGTPFGSGTITMNAGTLAFNLNESSGSTNGYSYLANNIALAGNATISAGGSKRIGILEGVISGSGALTLTTTAANNTSGDDVVNVLSNTNTYTGGTILNGVAAQSSTYAETVANAVNALGGGSGGTGGTVTFQNAQYLVLTASQSIAGLVTAATTNTNVLTDSYITGYSTTTAPTLTLNTANGVSSTFSGSIGGTNPQGFTYGSTSATTSTTAAGGDNINVVVTGAGTQVLSGANSYAGTTTINGGTLELTGTGTNTGSAITAGTLLPGVNVLGAAAATAITVNSGTLLLAANYTIGSMSTVTLGGGNLSLANGVLQGQGATVSGGAASGTSITGVGMLTLTAPSTLAFAGSSGTIVFSGFTPGGFTLNVTGTNFGTTATSADGSNDRLIFGADQTVNLADFTFNGVADATEVNLGSGYFEIEPVPEASTWAMVVAGMAAMLIVRRRCRRLA